MRTLNKCITVLLMISIIGLHVPTIVFCAEADRLSVIYDKPVTRHKVRTIATTKDAPGKKVKGSSTKTIKWLLVAAGAALVVGLVAADSGTGGDGQINSSSDTDSFNFKW